PDALAEADAAALRVQPEHGDGAGVAVPIALEDLDRRGLARPVRSEEREDLALGHIEAEPLDRLGGSVRLPEPSDADRRQRRHAAPTTARERSAPIGLSLEDRGAVGLERGYAPVRAHVASDGVAEPRGDVEPAAVRPVVVVVQRPHHLDGHVGLLSRGPLRSHPPSPPAPLLPGWPSPYRRAAPRQGFPSSSTPARGRDRLRPPHPRPWS